MAEPDTWDEIKGMRVKQIKEELDSLNVKHDDAFEKEDLVQRLMDARSQSRDDTKEDGSREDGAAPPTFAESAAQADILMDDPEGPKLMEKLQSDPRLMKAVMDISVNGDPGKYADDEEVMAIMRTLEAVAKKGMQ